MKVLKEEVFGPIAPIIWWTARKSGPDRECNGVRARASIWTRDLKRAQRMPGRSRQGPLHQRLRQVRSRLPFGGVNVRSCRNYRTMPQGVRKRQEYCRDGIKKT